MATTAAPYGAEPVGTLSSSGSFSGKVSHIPIATTYGTQISYGDFVNLAVTGTVQKETGTTTFNAGTIGIFMGCQYTDPTTNQLTQSQYWPASNAATDAVAFVCDDPNVVFMMQGDAAIAQNLLQSNVGINVTAGTTTIGRSKNAVNVTDAAATETLPLRIVGFVDGPTSAVGDAFTDVLCIFNGYHLNLSRYAATPGTGLALS
jgi:hypothetical protein